MIERQRAYGRRLCEGIVRYARGREDWALEMLDWDDAASTAALSGCDGLIARVLDERMAAALRRMRRPVVDVYTDPVRDAFASADQDADAIGRLAANHSRVASSRALRSSATRAGATRTCGATPSAAHWRNRASPARSTRRPSA